MEQLIEELVTPSPRPSPARVVEIQKEIQRLQRQPTGWHLGIALLKHAHSNFRFYGALTLTIKIQTDGAFLNTQNELCDAVLQELITSYVQFTNQAEQNFVLRKLCSTLVAFFLQLESPWEFPVRHVLTSFCGRVREHGHVGDFDKTWTHIQNIRPQQLRSIFWLSGSLVEEVARMDVKGVESAEIETKVKQNAHDVWQLTYLTLQCLHSRKGLLESEAALVQGYLLSCTESEMMELSKEALYTASSWIKFHPSPHFDDESISKVVNAVMPLILRSFFIQETVEDALHCLIATVQQAPKYLVQAGPEAVSTLLTSQQAKSYVAQLLRGDFGAEAIQFVQFVVSLIDLQDLSSPEAFQDQTLQVILSILRNLLYTPGTAIIVDEICQTVLEAFNQIADRWSDWVGSSHADQYLKSLITEACMQYAFKVQYPPQESEHSSGCWESNERAQFQDFRLDVQDLLLSSYTCIGPELIERLAAPLQSSDTSPRWEEFEALLFCLNPLIGVISNDAVKAGGYMSDILNSPKWKILIHNVNTAPDRARQGAINFISANSFILQLDHQQVLPCINFLFSSLLLQGSTTAASRAISSICHRQRSLLAQALPQFVDSISAFTGILSEDRRRVFGGVAAIIQALPTEEGKVAPLVRILDLSFQTSEVGLAQTSDTGLISANDLLHTLAAIGKGIRAPPEAPINLDAEPSIEEQEFWTEGAGRDVQQNVQNVINEVLTKYPKVSQNIEATCDILKAGYTESHPSPFKFKPEYSASFFAHMIHLDSPRIGVVLDTASSFLASCAGHPGTIHNEFFQVSAAITWSQRALLDSFAATKTYVDHEFTYSSLEYFTRMLPKYGYFFSDNNLQEAWQILFEFALLALDNSDTLPRRFAAQFWAAIFDHCHSLQPDASLNLATCIQHYGPRFAAILLRLLGGEAARSDLDVLCEPLKKLVVKQGVVGARLLRDAAADGQEGREDGRTRRFVQQVLGLRGARKTGEVVREFWMDGRGVAFAYAG